MSFATLERGCFGKRVLTHAYATSHACLFTRVSFGTLSVLNSSLLWTKALACKTISTVTLFVLLITYAHIWERSDTLSVPCHRTRARAFPFSLFSHGESQFAIEVTTTSKKIPRHLHRMVRTSLVTNFLTSQQSSLWNSQLNFQVHNLIDNYIMKLPNSREFQLNFGNRLSKVLWNAL